MTLNDLVPASADGAKSRAQRYFEAVPQHQAAVLNFLETLPETSPIGTSYREFVPQPDTPEMSSTATEFGEYQPGATNDAAHVESRDEGFGADQQDSSPTNSDALNNTALGRLLFTRTNDAS